MSPSHDWTDRIVTITLNTAVDRVLEVPDLVVGDHAKAREIRRYPAGKAINVSRALARVGRPSTATGFVGAEQQEMFELFLAQTGPGRIDPQLLSVHGRTRENITLIDPVRHTDTHIRDEGFEVTPADIKRIESKLALLAQPGTTVVISGSLPRGMGQDQLNQILSLLVDHHARLVLDLSGSALGKVHITPPTDKSRRGRKNKSAAPAPDPAVPLIWLIKPNRQELAELSGLTEAQLNSPAAVAQAAAPLLKQASWVVVTLGADGAVLVTRDGAWHAKVDVDPKRIINTVGCGDSMVAGLIDGALSDLSPDHVLVRGLSVATANALTDGVADFDAQQVRELQSHAKVAPVH